MHIRRLGGNIFGALVSRTINLISTVIIVPVALHGLGKTEYATLAVLLSATIFFSYADLGLGLAVVNVVSDTRTSIAKARAIVTRVWFFLSAVSIALVIAALVALAVGPPARFGGYLDEKTAGAISAAIVCIAAGIPTALVQRILFAVQRGALANAWQTIGKLASVGGVLLTSHFHGNLTIYIIAIVGLPAAVGWISTIWLFFFDRPDLRPTLLLFSARELWPDAKQGLQFTIMQLAVYAETGFDNALVAAFQGPSAVTQYDVYSRLFMYIPALVSIAAFPVWPAVRDAISRGDHAWASSVAKFGYAGVAAVATISSALLIAYCDTIATRWTGTSFQTTLSLKFAFGIMALLTSLGMFQSVLMNARGAIAPQTRFQVVAVPLVLGAKVLALMAGSLAAMTLAVPAAYFARLCIFRSAIADREFPVAAKNSRLVP